MSRRILLESMRQGARERIGHDSRSRSSSRSIGDLADPIEAGAAGASTGTMQCADITEMSRNPVHSPVTAGRVAEDAALHSPSIPPPSDSPSGAAESDNGEALHAWDQRPQRHNGAATGNPGYSGVSEHLSASAATLVAPNKHLKQQHPRQTFGERHKDSACSGSSGDSGRPHLSQRYMASEYKISLQPTRSPLSHEPVLKCAHDDALLSSNCSSTTAAAASSGSRHSVKGSVRRNSLSTTSTTDIHGNTESTANLSQRLSQRRSSATKHRKSLRSMSLSSPRAGAAARKSRCGSMTRMEASLVALQLELATEKRNNIEAEHRITTVNNEASRLREENARLSRELALASTTAHHSAGSHASGAFSNNAAAVSSSATPQGDAGALEAAKRIDALEARLSELARNMETKQRELDMKDERIRLLEHKLADQLLLSSGTGYKGMVPAGYSQAPHPTAVAGSDAAMMLFEQVQRPPSRTRRSSVDNKVGIRVHRAPSPLYWQAEAPLTTVVGSKAKKARSVNMHTVHASPSRDTDCAASRSDSALRARTSSNLLTQSNAAGSWLQATATSERPLLFTSPLRASQPDVLVNRPRSAVGVLRQPSPSSCIVGHRRISSSPAPGDTDSTKNDERPARPRTGGGSGRTRLTADTQSSCRRRNSTTPATGSDRTTGSVALAQITTGTKDGHSPARLGSVRGPRRPSAPVAYSMTTAAREDSQRATSRRSSVFSPMRRSLSTTGTAGHPMRLDVSSQGFGDQCPLSPPRFLHGGAHGVLLSCNSAERHSSTTRSVAQQSVRSSTSTRSRPQITYSAESEALTMKGTTTTVMFRSRNTASNHYRNNSYARDGAPLLPSRTSTSAALETPTVVGISTAVDGP
ncbi:hypothetical protein JKF63_05507 [Porcisia hertigi]|uniref:Uncharacterized protein n=1 Tax=Porcisia hertigi TaxID=2761500 RepID=A0A836LDJ3_9TRYP|nr:hypothetical protein JKF63_05507 [Porcisia hertigi]